MRTRVQKRIWQAVTHLVLAVFLAGAADVRGQFPPPIPGGVGSPPGGGPPGGPPNDGSFGGAPEAAPDVEVAGEGGRDKLILLNFRDAPLDQILQFYSELTGRTMIKSPGINATITIKGQTRLTVAEAMQALDAILAMNNVALVPMGEKFFKVVQPTAIRQEGMPIDRLPPEAPFQETDELISQILTLKHVEIAEVQPVIQTLIHGYGKIQPLESANSLLITDTSSNLQRIMEILEILDQPVEIKVETRIYEIRFAKASEIASKLNELIQESQDEEAQRESRGTVPVPAGPPGIIRARQPTLPPGVEGGGGAAEAAAALAERGIVHGKVKIIADDRTNILFVISRPENYAFFDRIIDVLDRSVEAEIVVRVEPLEYADAEEIAGILNEFIGAAAAEDSEAPAATTPGAETPAGGAEPAATPRSTALRDFVAQRAQARLREVTAAEATQIGRLDPDTRILADKRTNSLLLMGRRSDIEAVRNMIDQLDIMLAQVLIEAVIMEIDLRDNISHGIDWLQRSFTVINEEKVGPGGGLTVAQPVYAFGGGQRVLGSSLDFIDANSVFRDTPINSALSYYTTFYDLNLDAIIQLAAGSSDARILSTPVILTTDNTEAKILVGEERPVVTTSSTTDAGTIRSAYEYRNIGINLTVTPRINPERFVIMEVSQTADDVGGTVIIDGNEVPIITKREFEASIGVDSRETVVLGGMVRTDMRKARSKVPLLGDIPIVGVLFRADSKDDTRTELMVLITPYVMMTPLEAQQETRRLYGSSALPDTKWIRGWSDSKLAHQPDLFEENPRRGRRIYPDPNASGRRDPESSQVEPRVSVYAPEEADAAAQAPLLSEEREWVISPSGVEETPLGTSADEPAEADRPVDPPTAESDRIDSPVPMQ